MLNDLPVKEGYIEYNVPTAGKPCKTWYKVIGDLSSGRPLVGLHGGPGVNHGYLEILSQLTKSHSIPIVLYDQIGNANSTHLPEKMGDVSFFADQLFLDELDNLLKHLGIQDDYDLLGHSWGGMLGARHAAAQPKGLKRLILVSAPADMKLWVEAQNALRAKLPHDIQEILDRHEKNGTTSTDEYQKATKVFYRHYCCILDPIPDPVTEAFGWIGQDPTVYLTMNGENEFFVTGSLKEWSMIADAHKIVVPTLLINGRLDEAQDSVVQPFFDRIPKVKWVTLNNSSHMCLHEETERFMNVVTAFLSIQS